MNDYSFQTVTFIATTFHSRPRYFVLLLQHQNNDYYSFYIFLLLHLLFYSLMAKAKSSFTDDLFCRLSLKYSENTKSSESIHISSH